MNKGIIYALIASILWGFDYAISGKLFEKVSIYTSLFFQFIIGAILMLILGYYQIKSDLSLFGNNKTTWLFGATCLVFNLAMIFIASSIKESNATLAGLIEISYPIFIIICSYFIFGDNHITPSIIIGGILIFSGVIIISLNE